MAATNNNYRDISSNWHEPASDHCCNSEQKCKQNYHQSRVSTIQQAKAIPMVTNDYFRAPSPSDSRLMPITTETKTTLDAGCNNNNQVRFNKRAWERTRRRERRLDDAIDENFLHHNESKRYMNEICNSNFATTTKFQSTKSHCKQRRRRPRPQVVTLAMYMSPKYVIFSACCCLIMSFLATASLITTTTTTTTSLTTNPSLQTNTNSNLFRSSRASSSFPFPLTESPIMINSLHHQPLASITSNNNSPQQQFNSKPPSQTISMGKFFHEEMKINHFACYFVLSVNPVHL